MLRREAAGWLARLQSGRDPDVERKFQSWHDAHPAHARAFESVRRSYDQAGLLRHSPAFSGSGIVAPEPVTRAPRRAFAIAASLVLTISAAWLIAESGVFTGGTEAVMLATRVGEIKRVELADGSRVTLDTATSVEVEIGRSRRRALLTRGRARFEVARGNAPFVVETGSAAVTTSGSTVDVERSGDSSRIDILAGDATVTASNDQRSSLALRSGEGASARLEGGLVQTQSSTASADWIRGMLEFDGTPLEAAVGLANRYSSRRIILSGNFADLRVSGAFHAGDIAGLAKALADAFHLSIGQSPSGDLILSRPNPTPK